MREIRIRVEKTIAFCPQLARIFGSINNALFFQKLYDWMQENNREDGFVCKTKNEIEEETSLSLKQQDKCKNKLKKLGILETKLIKANGVPTLHYKIDVEKAQELIDHYLKREMMK